MKRIVMVGIVNKKRILIAIFLISICAVVLFPIVWLGLTSIRPSAATSANPADLPHQISLENYEAILFNTTWATAIKNSLFTSVGNVALCLAVSFPAAFAFSRYTFTSDKHLFFWLLVNRLGPPAAFIVPFLVIYHVGGMYDTIWAVIIVHALFNVPMGVWILSGFMSNVPKEVDEMAYINGYGLFRYWRKVFIPMIMTAIGITAFFLWMFSWTEMLLASTVTANRAYTLPAQLRLTIASMGHGNLWGQSAAAGIISLVPGVTILYFVKKYIAKGFTLGRL